MMDCYIVNDVPRERWLYADRTMKKWMGWLLSDHSDFLSANAKTGQPIPALPEMTADEIEAHMQHAWTNSRPVAVQLAALDDQRQPLIEGAVVGFGGGQVTLMAKETGVLTTLQTADMWHVAEPEPKHWWSA